MLCPTALNSVVGSQHKYPCIQEIVISSPLNWQLVNSNLLCDVINQIYSKPVFWTGAYFVASCGGVTLFGGGTRHRRAIPLTAKRSTILAGVPRASDGIEIFFIVQVEEIPNRSI
jgi:hypothetical protein